MIQGFSGRFKMRHWTPPRRAATVHLCIGREPALCHSIIVLRRARHLDDYKPVFEDWLWYAVFPFLAYAAIVVAAIMLGDDPVPALFIVGGASVLLVFIGIHNAWDTVSHVTIQRLAREKDKQG